MAAEVDAATAAGGVSIGWLVGGIAILTILILLVIKYYCESCRGSAKKKETDIELGNQNCSGTPVKEHFSERHEPLELKFQHELSDHHSGESECDEASPRSVLMQSNLEQEKQSHSIEEIKGFEVPDPIFDSIRSPKLDTKSLFSIDLENPQHHLDYTHPPDTDHQVGLQPGKFIVTAHSGILATQNMDVNSNDVGEYARGVVLEISKIMTCPQQHRVRGKIKNKDHWVSILDMTDGYMWAKPCRQKNPRRRSQKHKQPTFVTNMNGLSHQSFSIV